jgi:hypothetical protein
MNLQNKINYYLCPEKNFSMFFTPKLFGDDMSYLQINLDFTNTSILDTADDTIIQLKPKLNFINKNIFIDTQNKTHPYYQDIDSYWSGIDYETSKKTEFSLDPFEIWDDDNIFGNTQFNPIQTNVSNNSNGTIYHISVKTNRFDNHFNRTQPVEFLNYQPYLNLQKVMIYLNPIKRQTYRRYKKFATFLAEVSSVLSNCFMFFAVVMIRYNSVQGKNNMILSMFPKKLIENLKFFKRDFKSIFHDTKNIKENSSEKAISTDFLKDVPSKRNLKSDNHNEGINNNFIFR